MKASEEQYQKNKNKPCGTEKKHLPYESYSEKYCIFAEPKLKNMPTKNIFAGIGVKTTFVNIFYDELMKREFVTLADVMCIKRRLPKGFYKNNPKATLSKELFYNDLKKASSDVELSPVQKSS